MSIEQNIAALTAAVIELTNAIKAGGATTVPQAAAPVAPVAPVVQQFAPPAAAPAMPAPPTFAPPAFAAPAPAAPVAPSAPFTDGQGLIAYVMGAYKEMGPAKGANIQGVLTSLNYQNINDVKPEHYPALYQGVEALKKS
jgi:hypothetical protein